MWDRLWQALLDAAAQAGQQDQRSGYVEGTQAPAKKGHGSTPHALALTRARVYERRLALPLGEASREKALHIRAADTGYARQDTAAGLAGVGDRPLHPGASGTGA